VKLKPGHGWMLREDNLRALGELCKHWTWLLRWLRVFCSGLPVVANATEPPPV
jgi:hypothetical protein